LSPDKQQVEALATLLEAAGLDAADLVTAIATLASAKKTAQQKEEKTSSKKNVINKELVYPDENAIIYQRGDVKSRVYYFRTYDATSKKQYVKSLETSDRVRALAKARSLFQEIKGKVERNERLRSIITSELAALHLKHLEKNADSAIGVTKESLRVKRYYIEKWCEFIDSLGYSKTTIDRIPKTRVKRFGEWFFHLPKKSGNAHKPRSTEQINNAIGEVYRMYHQTAHDERYISYEQIPKLERLKEDKDTSYKRDILSEEQYTTFWKYMEYVYIKGKKVDADGKKVRDALAFRDKDELLKRTIFAKAQGILYNTGLRPSELLGLRWGDISTSKHSTEEEAKVNYRIVVTAENSKTGRKRILVAPVKKRFDIIRRCYEKLGVATGHDDFIFQTPSIKGKPYSRQQFYMRLKRVVKASGLQEELATENKVLSLYSSRHFFITMRLRYGKVPLYLLSKVVGSSVQNLTDVYGHIDTELEAPLVTRNMGRLIKNGFDMDASVTVDED
jgi:integrase